jgi:hypothetical protein
MLRAPDARWLGSERSLEFGQCGCDTSKLNPKEGEEKRDDLAFVFGRCLFGTSLQQTILESSRSLGVCFWKQLTTKGTKVREGNSGMILLSSSGDVCLVLRYNKLFLKARIRLTSAFGNN